MKLLDDVGVPKFLYEGLPYACFITTMITLFTPDVPMVLKITSGLLSIYAMFIVYARFDYRHNYTVQHGVPKIDKRKFGD